MKLFIPKDIFNNPQPPRVFLCTTGKKIIGELPAYDRNLNGKWNSYSEFSFSIDRQYTDIITGETKTHPLFDKAEGLRKVYVENIGYFIIQDPDANYSDKDTKTLSCFSSEYETGSKYLENFYVNTGAIESKEVIALESIHGYDYSIDKDNLYKLATGNFDPYENYYIKEYTETNSYVWKEIGIKNEDDYNSHFGDGTNSGIQLYIQNYPRVRFYWPTNPSLSLLHIIFEKIPGWKIGNVDVSLWRKERKFDEDRVAVYDFLMNNISDTFKCVVEWDTITNTVNFYEEVEDGINDDKTIQTRFDTDVYISRENLADEIKIQYSTDDIKTKLKVLGSDDLNIREVNLGRNYIMNLDFYHTSDWMEQDLFEAYDKYLGSLENYKDEYTEAVQGWVAANNNLNILENNIPADSSVLLIGDTFEKLFCTYTPINTAYLPKTIADANIDTTEDVLYTDKEYKTPINKSSLTNGESFVVQGYSYIYVAETNQFKCVKNVTNTTALESLIKKLNLYHVDEDINHKVNDNILLRLKNSNLDVATIRIYDPKKIADMYYDPTAKYYLKKTNSLGTEKYEPITISSQSEFELYDFTTDNALYTNDYKIYCTVTRASSGLIDDDKEWNIIDWINGNLTKEEMKLDGFKVQYIGIMGAYFVIAKDEALFEEDKFDLSKTYLEKYGIKLLEEKKEIYTTIFQTQTEEMLSQEKYQCTASDEPPVGNIAEGTRWLDTDSNPTKLYVYTSGKWVETDGDLKDYENYQRYLENYEKLQLVQEVLVKKKRQAEYTRDGFFVADNKIDVELYDENHLSPTNQSLKADMHRVAEAHFLDYKVTEKSMDYDLPLYTFTVPYELDKTFAVYLKGNIPYVAYADSKGVYQAIMNKISKVTDLENFFNEDQWIRLSPFIREDSFSDNNFLLTGYESEEERIKICEELMGTANKELNKICQPSLKFSMNMANILALPEFKSLINQFQLGNFIKVHIRDGYIKRARLLEISLNFDDLSDFSANFGDLVTTRSEIDKHAELLQQAVTAGKQVAASAGDWQRAVDKSNKLEQDIASGLQNAALEVGKASGQSIVWDQHGIWGRKLIDGTTDQYYPEQFRIINNKLVFSNDGFKTSKAVFGSYTINGETRWGPLAEYVTADTIEGKLITGGSIEIGTGDNKFVVNEDGSVEIKVGGQEKYASTDAVKEIDNAYRFQIVLSYDKSTVFSDREQDCTITCKVYKYDTDITSDVIDIDGKFSWIRISSDTEKDVNWNSNHIQTGTDANKVTLHVDDVEGNSQFSCSVSFDETQLKLDNTQTNS